MKSKAKETFKRLAKKNTERIDGKINVTLSLNKKLYEDAQVYLKTGKTTMSEYIEEILKELLGR